MASNSITLTSAYGGQYTLTIDASVSGNYVSATARLSSVDGSAFADYGGLTLSVNCGTSSNSKGVSSISSYGSDSVSAGGSGSYSTTYTCTASWSGGGGYAPGGGSVSVNVTTGAAPVTTYSLTLNATTGGTVSGGASGITSGSTRAITATPNDGYEFSHWAVISGNTPADVNSANTTVYITGNTNLTAHFVESGSAKVYINGEWKKAKSYLYLNGEWKKTKPYIYSNGEWRKAK